MGFAERGRLLHRLADLIDEHAHELAMADTTDMGKPISDALANDSRCGLNAMVFTEDQLPLRP